MTSILLYTTLPNVGGNTTITLGLSQFFRKHQLDVYIVIRPQFDYKVSNKMVDTLTSIGCKVFVLSDRKSNTWLTSIEAILKARKIHADAFISVGMGYVAPLMAAMGRVKKKYFYYINHDPEVSALKKLGILLNAFDAIITISPVSILPIKQLNKKLDVLWLPQFSELETKMLLAEKSSLTPRRFAFIGAFKKSKGILTLLSMWTSKKDESDDKLLILGDGEEKASVEKAANENNNIIYRGNFFATERETVLPHFFSEIDFLLVPSKGHGEGIPTVILEAFSFGVPVISTKGGGTIVFEDDMLVKDFEKAIILVNEEDFEASVNNMNLFYNVDRGTIKIAYEKWFSNKALDKKWLSILQ